MTDDQKERVALKADESSTIIADGAKISGFDKVAESTNDSLISLNSASIDLPTNNTESNKNTNKYWYKKPVGMILLTVVGGIIIAVVEKVLF